VVSYGGSGGIEEMMLTEYRYIVEPNLCNDGMLFHNRLEQRYIKAIEVSAISD
jgi:hypothetical protein